MYGFWKKISLSTFDLKMLGLILMVIDHVGEFFPQMPLWFRCLGRISAPLFFFCMVWGMDYTKSRFHYLQRLYVASLVMGAVEFALKQYFKVAVIGHHNIFSTLFIVGLLISLFQSVKDETIKKEYAILFFTIWVGLSVLVPFLFSSSNYIYILLPLFQNIFFCEGGIQWIILGVLLYHIKGKSSKLILGYSLYCALYALNSMAAPLARIMYYFDFYGFLENTFVWPVLNVIYLLIFQETYGFTPILPHKLYLGDYQWMMIGALPFMLLYNHKRGRSMKWFFYFFYPIHIVFLAQISNILLT